MNKFALITGASRGIGKAIAREFAAGNYNLYLTCKNNIAILNDYSKELENTYKISCRPFQCDQSSFDDVKTLFDNIRDLDVVVNNAGISKFGLLSDMTVDEWHEIMSSNLDSVFYTSKLAIPFLLKKHSGTIINISSVWGNVGASTEVAYSTSKGGINAFTKALAKELAPSGISVNAIACGVIDTDMNREHLTSEDLEVLREEIPADRLGTPEDVAKLALQLSQSPSYMTGQIINIDGGWI
ncbi:MAG: SDR family oxidoreductase [Butyrivibrio sp.]|nr:SDR family oxidoreductase [Butyrivibrio sp.]